MSAKGKADASQWYRVSAPYVTAKTMTQDGARIVGLHNGAPLPYDIPQDGLEHLIRQELVEPYPTSEQEQGVLAQARGLAPKRAGGQGEQELPPEEAGEAPKAEAGKAESAKAEGAKPAGGQQAGRRS
jgi:hypothetical protein